MTCHGFIFLLHHLVSLSNPVCSSNGSFYNSQYFKKTLSVCADIVFFLHNIPTEKPHKEQIYHSECTSLTLSAQHTMSYVIVTCKVNRQYLLLAHIDQYNVTETMDFKVFLAAPYTIYAWVNGTCKTEYLSVLLVVHILYIQWDTCCICKVPRRMPWYPFRNMWEGFPWWSALITLDLNCINSLHKYCMSVILNVKRLSACCGGINRQN